jgi:hypothetical protein
MARVEMCKGTYEERFWKVSRLISFKIFQVQDPGTEEER